MSDDFQDYVPTKAFTNVNTLLANHFKFVIDALPDLSFFVQGITVPGITTVGTGLDRPNPFTTIPEVPDHLQFGALTATYLVDARFNTYFSLLYWLKGVAHPHAYQETTDFNNSRRRRLGNPRPLLREIQKTHATLYLLEPDSDTTVAEFSFTDLFPTALGSLALGTTEADPPDITTTVTFQYTDFDVRLIS